MEISELLQIEGLVQTLKQGTQRDEYNYFVATNRKLNDQIFMCKTILDRLIDPPAHADKKRTSLWVHAVGTLAVERAAEIAMHLSSRLFPGQLSAFVYTETLRTEEEHICVTADGHVVERTSPVCKPAIKIRLSVLKSPESRVVCLNVPLTTNEASTTTVSHVA